MTPISNHRFTSFSTPTRPAGYKLQAFEFNVSEEVVRIAHALTAKKTIKRANHPSAPRRFSWEG